ncbi:hypothetical protein BXZ70DRAFT_134768 [Cristinia sonorae]|uniref:Uncharacterized protein n=1 Tax=Cristinia sonorae TaxID=1940300 RepID=A0A8K0UR69_9AGAR|nr:hypothetical protein BXZ70DRAFT_134768 [Cristinia sonorae]
MNSLWNLIDWLLPSIRLTDDFANAYDPEALSASSHHHQSSNSNYPSYNNSFTSYHCRESSPIPSLYPPSQSTIAPNASSHQEAVASNRGTPPEWKERDKRERERQSREREKERAEREQLVMKHKSETDALQKRIKSLESQVEKLTRELQISREDGMAIKKMSSQDYVPPPHSFPAVPPSDPAALRNAYDSMLSLHTHTHDALVERTEELASLKSFLSKTDDWSGAQLIQALRDLNTEIVHLAASLADELTSPSSTFASYRGEPTQHTNAQKSLIAGMIGVGMTNWLLSREHTEDAATIVQFAVQAWQVNLVGRALDSFSYGLPREIDQFLSHVFNHMHRTEPQATTSRWRALTYNHTRSLLASSSNPNHSNASPFQTLTDHNARGLLSIIGLCNFPTLPRETLLAHYGAHLHRITERTERLAAAMKEGVMSADFEVARVAPAGPGESARSKPFDESEMEDVYADADAEQECGVMCTVEFGLTLVRKACTDSSEHGDDSDTRNGHGTVNGHASTKGAKNGKKTNGHSPAANGHGKTNGILNGVGDHDPPRDVKPGSLTRTVLVKPRVLLDSVSQLE